MGSAPPERNRSSSLNRVAWQRSLVSISRVEWTSSPADSFCMNWRRGGNHSSPHLQGIAFTILLLAASRPALASLPTRTEPIPAMGLIPVEALGALSLVHESFWSCRAGWLRGAPRGQCPLPRRDREPTVSPSTFGLRTERQPASTARSRWRSMGCHRRSSSTTMDTKPAPERGPRWRFPSRGTRRARSTSPTSFGVTPWPRPSSRGPSSGSTRRHSG